MADIEPARYPNNYSQEIEAIQTFESLLDFKIIVPHLNRLDKIPNTDGYLEILDGQARPLGKVEVQIRKIPDGETAYSCPIELVGYSQRISLPFLLICVDVGNKGAYFKHIHASMPEFKPGQQSFTVKFDPNVNGISKETQYFNQWLELVQDYNRRVSDYPRLRQIESQLSPSHISKEDYIYFQNFIEHVNRLLDLDFPFIKELFFKGVWKIGVGVSSADKAQVCFQLYLILPGDSAVLVSGIQVPPNRPAQIPNTANVVAWHLQGQDGKTVQFRWRSRDALKSPKEEAQDFVFDYIRKALRQKMLPLFGRRLAVEYLFWFVDNFGASVGVEPADRLNIQELNYGISVYLPAWASLAVPKYLAETARLNQKNPKAIAQIIQYPPFENIACSRLVATEDIRAFIKSGARISPVLVRFWEASPQMLTNALDFLSHEGVDWIDRPYEERRHDSGSWVWNGYSADAFRHNAQSVFIDSLEEYRVFVERNQISLKKSFYLDKSTAVIYAGDFENWASNQERENPPRMDFYQVKNDDQKLAKLALIDVRKAGNEFSVEKPRLKIFGLEREIQVGGCFMPSNLFENLPMLTRVYSMLKEDLENEFGGKFS